MSEQNLYATPTNDQADTATPDSPQWQKDFPIDLAQDEYVARRDFTKFMVLTSFAFVVGQAWIGVQNLIRKRRGKPAVREVARVDQVAVGASLVFAYPDVHDTCLLVRRGENDWVAYSQKCTHLSCSVVPDATSGTVLCPCHNGIFDMSTGRPLAGPPRRPLPRITLNIRGGIVYATGVEVTTV